MVLLTVSSPAWPDELTGIGTAGLALITLITLLVTITLAARQRTHELRQLQDAEARGTYVDAQNLLKIGRSGSG